MIFLFIVIAFIMSFVGSLNGMGVSLILSLAMLLIDENQYPFIQWIPILASFLVAFIFVISRIKIFFDHFFSIILIGISSGLGILIGRILNINFSINLLRIVFGFIIFFITIYFIKAKKIKKYSTNIQEEALYFEFHDLLIIFTIGFLSGMFDFGISAFIYMHIFLKNNHYKIENIDVCVYSVIMISTLLKLVFTVMQFKPMIPSFISIYFFISVVVGAIIARIVYQYITPEIRNKIILTSLLLIALKMIVLNLNFKSFENMKNEINSSLSYIYNQ